MKKSDPDYPRAVEAAMEIIRERARERRTIQYGELSNRLALQRFRIAPHGDVMRFLLSDVSTLGNENGSRGMLSALVVTADFGVPAIGFFEFASEPPFSRRGERIWERERDHVWDDHVADG